MKTTKPARIEITVKARTLVNRLITGQTVLTVMPALGRCTCGTTVRLSEFVNSCGGCSATYNSRGQKLS